MFLESLVKTLHGGIRRYPEALAYLKSRYVLDEEIDRFHLGFGRVVPMPQGNDPEITRFAKETFRGSKLENRIIFPFLDQLGRVQGLAGRYVDKKDFKIFATEEAKFNGFFFGLYQALPHIYQENRVYVVEGMFDLLAFSKVFPNTVASITSGLNEQQHATLSMFCDKIITCFDSDGPGRLGTELAGQWDNVAHTSIGGNFKDPAACLEAKGIKEFTKYLKAKILPF